MQAEAANAIPDRSFILGALQRAAQATGADFSYMLGVAAHESGLKPTAKADTSSATGLFQFIDQSWLGVVKAYGAKHGLGSFADAITRSTDGKYHTSNPADRSAILALRSDPTVACLMEGEYAQASRATLENALGRNVCGGDLYMAHFLGDSEACRMIRMAENQPTASAAAAFPAAANANHSLFYHSDGSAKTVKEVYEWALRAPGASAAAALRLGPGKPTTPVEAPAPKPVQYVEHVDASAPTTGNDALLLSFASWRPTHGFFSNDATTSDGMRSGSSILLSPAIMDVLQSVETAPPVGAAH